MRALVVRAVAWAVTLLKLRALPGHRRIAVGAVVRGNVTMGDYTYVGAGSEIRGTLTKVSIGRYCSVGRDVKIFSAGQGHDFRGLSTYPFFTLDSALDRRRFNRGTSDTVIGNDVWIGSNSIIMPGVVIGDGAVVGSGAIVTRDIAPFAIVAGIPARSLGERFPPELAKRVQASRWWEMEYSELKRRYSTLISENIAISVENDLL